MTGSPSSSVSSRNRSVALIGPYGSGKSALFDALMATAGAPVKRAGDARTHVSGTDIRLGHCAFLGDQWSILDCPGSLEFSHETACALAAVDFAVVVCEPSLARAASLWVIFRMLESCGLPHLVFINKVDTLSGRVRDTLAALQSYSKMPLVLRQIPIREGDNVTGYIDVVNERAYRYRDGQSAERITLPADLREREEEARAGLAEVLADHDDILLEKILEDIAPTCDEIYQDLRKDQASGAIVEVLLGAAIRSHGIFRLWKALRHDVANASATAEQRGVSGGSEPLVQIFKTVHAAHTGKLSYARVWRGLLRDGVALEGGRVGGIYRFAGGEPTRVTEASAGDLVALGRLESAATGDVLGVRKGTERLEMPQPPAPLYALAIRTKDRKDDVKLSSGLHKLAEEDPSLFVVHDAGQGEIVLKGQGEVHLNAALDRLAALTHLELDAAAPKIAFKETIRHAVVEHGRLKRQTGGHGQFADVKLEIAPRARGEGFSFTDKTVGGAVPRQYIPAVREAAEDAMQKGPFGYPVVDVGVTLLDGGFHSVDSSEMAFKTATRQAIAEALAKADPILLEPIDHVTVRVPNAHTAGAQRLLTGRRGQILGYAERPGWPGWDEIQAHVPAAELQDFIIELRSETMGMGTFAHDFGHLAEMRSKPAAKLAAG